MMPDKMNLFRYLQTGRCHLILPILAVFLFSCRTDSSLVNNNHLFTLLPSSVTGIDFANDVAYTEELNAYTFRNFYNGGGVAVGDVNNDGLPDIFFCGNMKSNRLYLNKGNFKF